MDESEERWERMERTMEFLLQSDARLTARLDTMGDRLDTQGGHLDTLKANTERQQILIDRLAHSVDSMHAETREAVGRMLEIAEGIGDIARTFGARTIDHEQRIRRLEDRIPPDAA